MKTFRPSAAIFDMDGLMLDTERPFIRLWAETGKKFGYDVPPEVVKRMVGISNDNCRIIMLKEYGEDFPFDKILEEFRDISKKEFEKGIPVKKGLLNLLDHFTAAKIPMGVATSTRKTTAERMLTIAGIKERFNAITGGDEVENGKPAPDIFLLAAKRLGYLPCECVGFEDSPAGLKGLYSAGIKSVFIKDLIEPPQEILASVWKRCVDLDEAVQLFDF